MNRKKVDSNDVKKLGKRSDEFYHYETLSEKLVNWKKVKMNSKKSHVGQIYVTLFQRRRNSEDTM